MNVLAKVDDLLLVESVPGVAQIVDLSGGTVSSPVSTAAALARNAWEPAEEVVLPEELADQLISETEARELLEQLPPVPKWLKK